MYWESGHCLKVRVRSHDGRVYIRQLGSDIVAEKGEDALGDSTLELSHEESRAERLRIRPAGQDQVELKFVDQGLNWPDVVCPPWRW